MKRQSSIRRAGELILVDAKVAGPTAAVPLQLVLDTGAAATTLVPRIAAQIGYSERDGYRESKVRTALSEERGYWVKVARLDVLGLSIPNFALTIFPLAYDDLDGLVGMNLLRDLNFEVRPAEHRILIELIQG